MTLGRLVALENANTHTQRQKRFMFYKYRFDLNYVFNVSQLYTSYTVFVNYSFVWADSIQIINKISIYLLRFLHSDHDFRAVWTKRVIVPIYQHVASVSKTFHQQAYLSCWV